jgi:hypothetical protein
MACYGVVMFSTKPFSSSDLSESWVCLVNLGKLCITDVFLLRISSLRKLGLFSLSWQALFYRRFFTKEFSSQKARSVTFILKVYRLGSTLTVCGVYRSQLIRSCDWKGLVSTTALYHTTFFSLKNSFLRKLGLFSS